MNADFLNEVTARLSHFMTYLKSPLISHKWTTMQLSFLAVEQVADLIEKAEQSGNVLTIQQTTNEVVYHLQDHTGERMLINTPYGSYLIQNGASDAWGSFTAHMSHQRSQSAKYC